MVWNKKNIVNPQSNISGRWLHTSARHQSSVRWDGSCSEGSWRTCLPRPHPRDAAELTPATCPCWWLASPRICVIVIQVDNLEIFASVSNLNKVCRYHRAVGNTMKICLFSIEKGRSTGHTGIVFVGLMPSARCRAVVCILISWTTFCTGKVHR